MPLAMCFEVSIPPAKCKHKLTLLIAISHYTHTHTHTHTHTLCDSVFKLLSQVLGLSYNRCTACLKDNPPWQTLEKGQHNPHDNFRTDQNKRKSDLLEKHSERHVKCLLSKVIFRKRRREREKKNIQYCL